MTPILLYKMTIWTGPRYDETGHRGVLTIEAYFTVALEGSVHENRQKLADIGISFFQDKIREWYGMPVPDDQIKVRFEREQAAVSVDDSIQVEFREMTYIGRQVSARTLPMQTIELEVTGEEEPRDAEDRSYQDFLNQRNDLVNAYSRGYRDGSISAGFPTSLDMARRYGREFAQTLREEEVWEWQERDAYDQGRLDAREDSEESEAEDYENGEGGSDAER